MDTVISIIKSTKSKQDKLSDILKFVFVDTCGISQDKYFILGSYAIRAQRTISDLDINLDNKEFLKLEKAGLGQLQFYNGQIRWFLDLTDVYNKLTAANELDFSIEAFMKEPNNGFPNDKFSLAHLRRVDGLERDHNGHQFFSMKTLLSWKQTMNREKDKPDIELINTLLGGGERRRRSAPRKKSRKKVSRRSRKR